MSGQIEDTSFFYLRSFTPYPSPSLCCSAVLESDDFTPAPSSSPALDDYEFSWYYALALDGRRGSSETCSSSSSSMPDLVLSFSQPPPLSPSPSPSYPDYSWDQAWEWEWQQRTTSTPPSSPITPLPVGSSKSLLRSIAHPTPSTDSTDASDGSQCHWLAASSHLFPSTSSCSCSSCSASSSSTSSSSPSRPSSPPSSLSADSQAVVLGAYTRAERAAKIARYREKRLRRQWKKKIIYECRKVFADSRQRVGGRFIKTSVDAARMQGSKKKRVRRISGR